MSNLSQVFAVPAHLNPGNVRVRTEWVDGVPMFCLADICQVLGLSDARQVAERLDEDDRCRIPVIDAMGRKQKAYFVTEPGLYAVLLGSDKPAARPFKRWVTNEVIPTIRKTGSYSVGQQPARRPWYERLDRCIVAHRIAIHNAHAPGYWSVYSAVVTELLIMEDEFIRHCLPLQPGDLPDGSIGICWSNYRHGWSWAGPRWSDCELHMPHRKKADGSEFRVRPFVYSPEELPRFQTWLYTEYLPTNLPKYLGNKFSSLRQPVALASASDHACRQLTGRPAALPEATRAQLSRHGGLVRIGAPANQAQLTLF